MAKKIARALRPQRPLFTPDDIENMRSGSRPRPLHGRGSPAKPVHDDQTVDDATPEAQTIYLQRSMGEYNPYAARKLLDNHRIWPGTAYSAAPGECRWCGRMHYRADGTPNKRKSFCDMACQREYDLRADPKLMRRYVYDRDLGICADCRTVFDYFEDDGWEADHIKPLFMARGDWSFWDPENVTLRCIPCHREKTKQDNKKYRAHRHRRRERRNRQRAR